MNHFKKRKILLAFLIALTIIIVVISLRHNKTSKSQRVITLVTSRWSGPHADFQRELLSRYERETGIRVIQDDVDYGQLKSKQVMNLGNKTGEYDLVWVLETWVKEYIASGYILPLNPYFKTVPEFSLDHYLPELIKNNTISNKVYGIPTMLQTAIVAYDKRALNRAELNPPNTWDEMLTVASFFKKQGTGIALPVRKGRFDDNIWEALMYSSDGAYLDKSGLPSLDSQENVATLKFYQRLMKYSMKGSLNWHVDEANRQLQFGYAPIAITISGLAGILEDPSQSKIAQHVGYLPLPYKNHPAGTLSFWNWCIPADSKHPEEAFKLLAWLTSAPIEKTQSLTNGQLSALNSLFYDEEITRKLPYLPAIVTCLQSPHTSLNHPNGELLVSEMMEVLFRVSVSDVDPAKELSVLQDKMLKIFKTSLSERN